jgi:RNA polymerase sigma-70 factor (ECF subfamily)
MPSFLNPLAVLAVRGDAEGAIFSGIPANDSIALEPRPSPFAAAEVQLARIAQGDCAELGRAYDEHHRAVRAFALRFVGDPSAAEDLVHDAFVALPRAARGFRGQCSVRTFIISVALNHSRHHLRSAKRRRAATERLAVEPVQTVSGPDQELSRRELASALTRALDTLPTDQRAAFVMCDVEERDSREVAQLVGAPAATVRTRLFHARRKLRRVLATMGLS